ncbi:hypothetical protein RU01_18395 [Rhodococcus sp. MEB064]|nr:hypothetical protein RU01_18395 [Rhodococcus sp. MEB064]
MSFRFLHNVRVYGPFDLPDQTVVEDRLRALFSSERGRSVLRSVDRDRATEYVPRGRHAIDAVLDRIVRRSSATSARELFDELMELAAPEVPLEITVSDQFIGVRPNHSFSDGTSGNAWVVAVVSAAAGTPDFRLIDDLVTSMALPRAVARTRLFRPRVLRAALSSARQHVPEIVPPEPQPRAPVRTAAALLDLEDLRRYAASVAPPGEKLSVASALSLLVLRSASDIVPDDLDLAVLMSFEARRYLGSGHGTSGNFAPALTIGRLRDPQWSPAEISARLSTLVESSAPLAVLLRGAALDYRPHRALTTRRGGATGAHVFRPGRSIALSNILPTPGYDDFPWSSPVERCCMSAAVTPSGIGITVYTERAGGVLTMSVVDDSQLIDVDTLLDTVVRESVVRVHGRV